MFRSRTPISLFINSTPFLFAESNRRRKHLGRVHYGDETNPLSKPTILDKSTLYIVPTPIGNIKDFSLRSLEVIRQVDYLFCINKVATQVLLDIIDINSSGRLLQYNKHARSQARLAELVKTGASAALICPQGMPVVGDQGVDVIQQFLKEGVRVSCLPGPAACISALAMSGSNGSEDAFFFGGHFSLQRGTRMRQIKEIVNSRCPSVFYEATPRLRATLEEIQVLCGEDRVVSVVHEISKVHEATHRDRVVKLSMFYLKQAQKSVESKGQVTIVIDAEPERERAGHRLYSASVRNELQKEKGKWNPNFEEGESLAEESTITASWSKSSNNNSSGANNNNISFKDKTLYRLVHEQGLKQKMRMRSSVKNGNNDFDDANNTFVEERFTKPASVFIAEEMEMPPHKVWRSYNKVREHLVNETYRADREGKKKTAGSDVNDDLINSDENEKVSPEESIQHHQDEEDYREEFDEIPGIRNRPSSSLNSRTKSKFNLVKSQDEVRSATVEGDEHFPSDWIPEGQQDNEEDDVLDTNNMTNDSNKNQTDDENHDDSSSVNSSDEKSVKAKRRLEAKRKLMKAIAAQSFKTELARKQLKEDQRDLDRFSSDDEDEERK